MLRRLVLAGLALCAGPALSQTLQYGLQRPALASPDAPEAAFGRALVLLDDLDGDGTPDLAVGSPGADAEAGAVHLYSGRTLRPIRTVAAPRPAEAERFGATAVATPDLTGDGRPDLLVGAPTSDPGESGAGRAYLVDPATGAVRLTLASPDPQFDARFGAALAAVPDLSGDGVADLAVGEPDGDVREGDRTLSEAGRVHLYSGADGSYLYTLVSPFPDPDSGLFDRGGDFGLELLGVRDLTGDGRGEVLVGAPGEEREGDEFGAAGGHVWLFAGGAATVLVEFKAPQIDRGDRRTDFGEAIALVPDRTGDGVPELIAGAPDASAGSLDDVGIVHVLDGATGQALDRWFSPELAEDQTFGDLLSLGPDLTGDGTPEVVVVETNLTNTDKTDAAWVLDGRTGALLFSADVPYFPWDIYGALLAPDLDGDGRPELFVATDNETFDGDEVVYAFNLDPASSEVEPNDTPDQAQRVVGPSPRVVQGRVDGYDDAWVDGQIVVSVDCDSPCSEEDAMEDTYRVTTTAPGLDVRLEGLREDVDLYVFEAGTLAVVGRSIQGGTDDERVTLPALPAGEYLVGVSMYGEFGDDSNGSEWTPYTLTVEGALGGAVAAEDAPGRGGLALLPPAPNPTRGGTRLAFHTDVAGRARLRVVDALGRDVARPLDGQVPAGDHEVTLDLGGVAAGVYVVRLETDAGARTRTLSVVR